MDLKEFIGMEAKNISPSPFGRWLNGTLLDINDARTKTKTSFIIREEFANPLGILHGGIASGMMDEVMGMAVFVSGHSKVVALNLNVDFLRAGKVGETVYACTEIIRSGKSVVNIECKLLNEKEEIVAKAASNLFNLNR